jgi:colicin import membrane protein
MTDANTQTSGSVSSQEQPIAILVQHHPEVVLLDDKKRDALFEHINNEIAEFKHDLSTAAGRDATRAFAAKIVKTKTAAEAARTSLTEEWRTKTATVNTAGKVVKETLTEMAARARAPLTEWETAEETRVTECEGAIAAFTRAGVVAIDATSQAVRDTIADLEGRAIDAARFQGMTEAAIKARNHALELLNAALARIEKAEADAAELEALRRQAAERAAEDEARRLADEAAAAAKVAEEAEAARAQAAAEEEKRRTEEAATRAAEEAEAAKLAQAEEEKRRAAQQVEYAKSIMQHIRDVGMGMIGGKPYPYVVLLRELEEKIPPEIDDTFGDLKEEAETLLAETLVRVKAAFEESQQRAQQQAEAAAREAEAQEKLRAESERAAQLQREKEEREAEDERNRIAAEKEAARVAKLEEDMAHRTKCKAEAKDALLTTGITEEHAKAIIILILTGEVPRVSLDFAAEPKVKKPEAETAE